MPLVNAVGTRTPRWIRIVSMGALLFGLLAVSEAARADCSAPGGVHLNEVRFVDSESPGGENHINAMVELFNKNVSSTSLSGWTLRDQTGATLVTIPGISLPSAAHFLVEFGSGTNDLDFSDGIGTIFTNGDSTGVFNPEEGGVALHDSGNVIRDYVTWSLVGVPAPGPSLSAAIVAGIWPATDFVPVVEGNKLFTIRLVSDGYDDNLAEDWIDFGWGESIYGQLVPGSNPVQIGPASGTGHDPGFVTLSWTAHPNATAYRLVVSTDSLLASGIEIDTQTTSTDTTLTLPAGVHYWRVRIVDSCGEVLGGEIWDLTMFVTPTSPTEGGAGVLPGSRATSKLGVARRLQHKDTKLLCIYYDDGRNKRPGCRETGVKNGPWDGVHADDHAVKMIDGKKVDCEHCGMYCGRACAQMLNHFYGGDLSQDRISYDMMAVRGSAKNPSPEGDLGHDRWLLFDSTAPNLEWALRNSTVTGPFGDGGGPPDPTYGLIKDEIVAGFPVRCGIPQHAILIDGYKDKDSDAVGNPKKDMVHVRDPWPTSKIDEWTEYDKVGLLRFWRIRKTGVPAIAGRMQDSSVVKDTDADGVMDFDEGAPDYPAERPRKLQSKHNTKDTDNDLVQDKQEIRSYTFHDLDHAHENDAITFADVDGDALRTEADPDSDGDKDADGNEDINGNGIGMQAGETCVFDSASKQLAFNVTTQGCGGQVRGVVTGGTMRGIEEYNINIAAVPCADPVQGAPLTDDGDVTTGTDGNIMVSFLQCKPPGQYRFIIDAIPNGVFDTCCDPVICGQLVAVDAAVIVEGLPTELALGEPFPNPFRTETALVLALPREGVVDVRILDTTGRLVKNLRSDLLAANRHELRWNGLDEAGASVAPGLYFVEVRALSETLTQKVLKLR